MRTNTSSSSPNALKSSVRAGGSATDLLAQGTRWHGARLASGLIDIEDAAWAFDVSIDDLKAIEAGVISANDKLRQLLPKVYGVDPSYADVGAQSERELFADRLGRLLDRASAVEHAERLWWPQRLARIGAMMGSPIEEQFIARLSWLFPSYVDSQIDGRSAEWAMGATVDLQIGLCLAMGAMPEYGLISQLPIWPRASETATWWRPLRRGNFAFLPLPIESEDWAWLDYGASYCNEMSLQVVEFDGRSFNAGRDERLKVSRSSLPAAGAAAGGCLYALRGKVGGKDATVVLDPERGNGACLMVDRQGMLSLGTKRDPHLPSQDPIRFSSNSQTAGSLGRVVACL